MVWKDLRTGVSLRPFDLLSPQRPPTPADYRELAALAYESADLQRALFGAKNHGKANALDPVGWEAERAAEDLEELEGD